MGKIILKNIRTYSYHGCLVEESKIGSNYRTDIEIGTDLTISEQSDNLQDTVDYVLLNRIVVEEMAIRSNLLEHVARRIITTSMQQITSLHYIKVAVSKLNPPIGGDVQEVIIEIEEYRK